MIINGASCANATSITLVRKFNLNTIKHPKPYRLWWLNECGEVKVIKHVLISFAISRYSDDVIYNVVPMHASHLFLGHL